MKIKNIKRISIKQAIKESRPYYTKSGQKLSAKTLERYVKANKQYDYLRKRYNLEDDSTLRLKISSLTEHHKKAYGRLQTRINYVRLGRFSKQRRDAEAEIAKNVEAVRNAKTPEERRRARARLRYWEKKAGRVKQDIKKLKSEFKRKHGVKIDVDKDFGAGIPVDAIKAERAIIYRDNLISAIKEMFYDNMKDELYNEIMGAIEGASLLELHRLSKDPLLRDIIGYIYNDPAVMFNRVEQLIKAINRNLYLDNGFIREPTLDDFFFDPMITDKLRRIDLEDFDFRIPE